jgi:hypothetical protein
VVCRCRQIRTTGNGSWPGPPFMRPGHTMVPGSVHLGIVMESIAGFPQTQTIAPGLTTIFRLS